jgi:cytochrome c-type biogenesis protein
MQSLPIAAFVAGLISFLSPCVLPLVPGYISLISGVGVEELKHRDGRLMRAVVLNSMLFILGFSAVFLALGAAATALGQFVREHIGLLSKIAGGLIVLLGLHQTGALPIRLLYADKRFHVMPEGAAGTRAFLAGSAFGFGWSPCIGPILATILTFAAAESTVAKGVWLLAVYAMGLALPFLITAFSIEGFLAFYVRFRRHLHKLEIGSGVVMVAVGVLIFTGHLTLLNIWMNKIPFFRSMAQRFL